MKQLSTYNFKGLFMPNYIREKSSFFSEFYGIWLNKVLPDDYEDTDIRSYLHKHKIQQLRKALGDIKEADISEQIAFLMEIKRDATESFNALASIINGEQQNLFIYDRLTRLNLKNVFLSGVISQKNQIVKIELQLVDLRKNIKRIRKSYKTFGTNINLTYRVEKLSSDLTQALDIIRLCKADCPLEETVAVIHKFIDRSLLNLKMGHFLSSKSRILTKTVTEHNSEHGERYIATNLKQYVKIFQASLIGGVLIAIFALFKIKIESWGFSLLGEGILFGLNYAICFIIVDILGGIIATKQPAMTANTLLSRITKSDSQDEVANKIANVFTDVSKSQFVSFLGNLSVAFLISIVITYFFSVYYDSAVLSYEKGKYLLAKNNILTSASLFYAAIAGVFLSLSGLIAGYMDNVVLFYKLKDRLSNHYHEKSKRYKIGKYMLKKTGKFSGSFSLGMFLGLAGAVGLFTGTPFDIRHVAFSSAQVAYGSMAIGLDWLSQNGLIFALSILCIGITNFLVSFIFTLVIALSTKKTSKRVILKGFKLTAIYFFTKPWLFVLPVKFKRNLPD